MICRHFAAVLPLVLSFTSAHPALSASISNQASSAPLPRCSEQVETASLSPTSPQAPALASPSTIRTCDNVSRNTSSIQVRGMNVINQSPGAGQTWKDPTDWWLAFLRVNNMTQNLNNANSSTNVGDTWNMTNALGDSSYAANSLNAVRLYSTTDGDTQHLANALPEARFRNLSIHAGIWSGGDADTARFAAEKAALDVVLGQYGCDNIVAVSVGSEDLYRNLSTEITKIERCPLMNIELLVNHVQDVKGILNARGCCDIRVTHTDTFDQWLNTNVTGRLIEQLDFLTVNIFPYWEGKSIDEANTTFWTHFQAVKDMASQYGKEVWLGETGWPITGQIQGSAEPGLLNLQRYWNEVGCKLMEQDNFFWFAEWDEVNTPSFGVTRQGKPTNVISMTCTPD